jgi:hypothetical protein
MPLMRASWHWGGEFRNFEILIMFFWNQ